MSVQSLGLHNCTSQNWPAGVGFFLTYIMAPRTMLANSSISSTMCVDDTSFMVVRNYAIMRIPLAAASSAEQDGPKTGESCIFFF